VKEQPIRAYLDTQKSDRNRPWVIAFPTLYPREILTALDLNAWEIWAHTVSDGTADPGKLQGYLCPTVRGAQAVLARADHGAVAAIVPHTCDSMQGLGMVARASPEWGVRVITFRHPRGSDKSAARRFLRKEVEAFAADLETSFDRKLQPDKLADAIDLHRQVERAMATVLRRRAHLPMSDAELYGVLRAVEWMHPSDLLVELQKIVARISDDGPVQRGVALVVSGMVPEPDGLFDTLSEAGAFVAGDDYAAIGRRLPVYERPMPGDPIGSVVERLLSMQPCPTRSSDSAGRIARLSKLARETGARGVVLHTVKFCEPELFDVPIVRRGLEAAGLKVLHLETELEPRVTGQIATRIEAFVEMLSGGRGA